MAEFLDMGGYGFYIWGSYLVTGVLMVLEVILVRRRRSQLKRRLDRMGRMQSHEEETRLDHEIET
ncbi:MAG: heme exporter protein CcmD [Gammaproteobacteria bacterium]|nr:heme exporter protein CcmD [Gammaproteobacteria bacterium]